MESVTDNFAPAQGGPYVSTSTHDFKFGEVASTTDENGQVISNSYDNFGRLVSVIGPYEQGTGNTTIAMTYTPTAAVPFALTSHVDSFRAAGARIETVLFTDGLKRAVQTKKDAAVSPQAGIAPTDVMTVSGRIIFDPFGRIIQEFYPVTEPLNQQGVFNPAFDTVQPTVTTYDILDRVTKVTIPDNTTTTSAYDFAADRGGQARFRTTMIDANGVRKETFHDVRAQITTVNEFNNGGTAVFHTSYAYDPVRQITSVTDDQGNVTSVAYDLFGRRTAINNPDAGLTTFTYDLADNLTAKQTADLAAAAQQVTYAYQFNRVTAINYPAFPANNVTYTYGAAAQRNPSAVGNVVGRITHITDGAGTEDRLYGPLGEIVQETRAIPTKGNQVNTYITKFQFDTWNRMQSMVYPDQPTGEVLTYTYDSGGLVNHVSGNDDAVETFYASNIVYDKFGQRLSITNGNGVITTYAYDPLTRRLTNVQATVPIGYTFHNMLFSYDKVGNVTQIQNQVQPPVAAGLGNAIGGSWQKCYAYDDLYRLISSTGSFNSTAVASCSDSTAKNTYSFSQSYNSIHNITHKTQTATQSSAVQPQTSYDFAYTYPAAGTGHPHGPTAIGGFTITQDANGNQIQTLTTGTSNATEYLYDEENRLTCVNKGKKTPTPSCTKQDLADFTYDHAGVRKIKEAATPTIFPNQYFTDIGPGSGNQFKHIFIGSERILTKKARSAPDLQHWYYHPDHLGSTSMVTDENAKLADHLHYFPFGEVWLEERPAALPEEFFFTAKEFDPETGFYDFGARYLDPRFSKWMTADPALGSYLPGAGKALSSLPGGGGALRPANLALYGYGHQNPATLRDSNGNWTDYPGDPPGEGRNSPGCVDIMSGANLCNPEDVRTGLQVGMATGLLWAGVLAGPEAAAGVTAAGIRGYAYAATYLPRITTWVTGLFAAEAGVVAACRSSFAEETLVTTPDGLKPISELKVGDSVLAQNEVTGAYAFEPVTQVVRHLDPVKVHLTLEDPATGTTEVIDTTPEHRFYVPGHGFTAAAALKVGDPISRATLSVVRLAANLSDAWGALRVKALTFEDQPFVAYNLEVAEHHTFFVGKELAWVHNPTCAEMLETLASHASLQLVRGTQKARQGLEMVSQERDQIVEVGELPPRAVDNQQITLVIDAQNGALIEHRFNHATHLSSSYVLQRHDPCRDPGTARLAVEAHRRACSLPRAAPLQRLCHPESESRA